MTLFSQSTELMREKPNFLVLFLTSGKSTLSLVTLVSKKVPQYTSKQYCPTLTLDFKKVNKIVIKLNTCDR